MDGGEQLTGRARVRALLIEPLEAGGMRKSPRVTVDEHKVMLAKMADKVGYLSDLQLAALGEYLIKQAGEAQVWPKLNIILQAAWSLAPEPNDQSAYVQSVLESRLGEQALDEGWHAELLKAMRLKRPVPRGEYMLREMRDKRARNEGHLNTARDRVRRGVASRDDRAFIEAYQRGRETARAMIEQGIQKRGGAGK